MTNIEEKINIQTLLTRLESKKTAAQLFAQGLEESLDKIASEEVEEVEDTKVEDTKVEDTEAETEAETETESENEEEEEVEEESEYEEEESEYEEDEKTAAYQEIEKADQYARIMARSFFDEYIKLASHYENTKLANFENTEYVNETGASAEVEELSETEKIASAQNILYTLYNTLYN